MIWYPIIRNALCEQRIADSRTPWIALAPFNSAEGICVITARITSSWT